MLIPAPADAVSEILEKRNFVSKTFDMGGGKRRLIVQSSGIVHYKDGGVFKDIDTNIIQIGNDYSVDKTPFLLSIPEGVIGFDYTSRQGGTVSLRLTKINDAPVRNDIKINPILKGNELWLTIGPDLTFYIKVREAQVQVWKIVDVIGAPHNWTWEITENNTGSFSVQTDLKAWDNQNDLPNIGVRSDEKSLRRRAIIDVVINGKNVTGIPYEIREELTNRTVRREPTTRIKSTRIDETKYPVLIDQDITETIVNTADDGEELTYGSTWDQNSMRFGNSYADDYHAGVRFRVVNVPAGATIDLANLIVYVKSFNAGTPRATTKVYSDAVADAALWSSSSRPSQITKSTAFTTFQPTTTGSQTIVVTSQIQEIMDASFVSGDDMRLAILNQNSGSDERQTLLWDYYDGSANVAKLEIDYTEAVSGEPLSAYTPNEQISVRSH